MSEHDLADAVLPRAETSASPSLGFAARLREETKLVHREAERSGFIADLIRGRATRAGYTLFLRNLVPAYAALEASLDAALDAPVLVPFRASALRRLPSLLRDIEVIDASVEDEPALSEARAYARAITAAAADPSLLAAHAYARYLGDLSGGQILKPILARSLGLAPEMLSFYDFPDVLDADVAKTAMREALDTLPAEGAAADALCREAIEAFRHNIALSVAVSRALQPAD